MKGLQIGAIISGIVILIVLFMAAAALYTPLHASGLTYGDASRCTAGGYYYNAGTSVCQFNTTNTTAMPYDQIGMGNLLAGTLIALLVAAAAVFAALKVFKVI